MTIASTISSTPSGHFSAGVFKSIFCSITRIFTLQSPEKLVQSSENLGQNANRVEAIFKHWNVELSIAKAENLAWVIRKLATRNMCHEWVIFQEQGDFTKKSGLKSRLLKITKFVFDYFFFYAIKNTDLNMAWKNLRCLPPTWSNWFHFLLLDLAESGMWRGATEEKCRGSFV